MIRYHVIIFLCKVSGKVNQWAWQKLWKNRSEGNGYRYLDRNSNG